MRKGGFRLDTFGWFERLTDWAMSGLEFKRQRFGRAAGHLVCTGSAIGTFAELDARDDIKAISGAMAWMTDRGSFGSAWVVLNGEWMPDGTIYGIGSPEGAVAAPPGAEYFRIDAGATPPRFYKQSGTGNTGWTNDVQGAMVDVVDPTREYGITGDGATLATAYLQAAQAKAKKAAVGVNLYGLGGKVRLQVGVWRVGPHTWSRWVTQEGSGALGSTVEQSDYSNLNGVPGIDAHKTMLDDGTGQYGIVGQQRFHNICFDGRRATLSTGVKSHWRDGLYFPEVVDGTDRVCTVGDMQIMNFPGAAWRVVKNDQVRGGNVKVTGNRMGLWWDRVKDGKVDQLGSGANGVSNDPVPVELMPEAANVFDNCASLKIGKVDFWTGGNSGPVPLLLARSCAKLVIGEGEFEGMVVVQGDNADDGSKSYRQRLMNTFQSINFKVSEDLHAAYVAAGITANVVTGAGYVAHMKLIDANGTQAPNCSISYKLGQPADSEGVRQQYLAATPPVAFWFGTVADPGDPNYSDFVKTCGDLDITGATLTWWDGKDSPGGKRTRAVYGFKEHIANMPHKLRGLRLGHVILRPTGTQQEDEVPLSGSLGSRTYTTQYDKGLLYLRLDPNWGSGDWSLLRKLTDEDSPGLGYKTFTVPDWSAQAPAGSTFYMVYKQ